MHIIVTIRTIFFRNGKYCTITSITRPIGLVCRGNPRQILDIARRKALIAILTFSKKSRGREYSEHSASCIWTSTRYLGNCAPNKYSFHSFRNRPKAKFPRPSKLVSGYVANLILCIVLDIHVFRTLRRDASRADRFVGSYDVLDTPEESGSGA